VGVVLLAQMSRGFGFGSPARKQVAIGDLGHNHRPINELKPLHMAEQDEVSENDIQDPSGFDGKGFAGYLAPYALAVLISIAVTAAIFKFVLLDY
jgi:hypothetical protein